MAPRKTAAATRPQRLEAADWIEAAQDALATGGVEAVRVEPLAKALAVTKGSFYWHFADRRALLDAVLDTWAQGRIAAIRQQVATGREPEATLRHLAELLYPPRQPARAVDRACHPRARPHRCGRRARRARRRSRNVSSWSAHCLPASAGRQPTRRRAPSLFYSFLFGESLLDARTVTAPARDNAVRALIAPPA
ncbi:MAG: TetR/AcrR family transcriptional regulator [Pseudorhodoplanes sp.]|nr:TetR/AcrR family transcriptional regulator [Pseudorhodoplanes sp.]